MKTVFNYFKEIYLGIITLLKGMKVTGHYFIHPGQIVTQRYPENRDTLEIADRFKG